MTSRARHAAVQTRRYHVEESVGAPIGADLERRALPQRLAHPGPKVVVEDDQGKVLALPELCANGATAHHDTGGRQRHM